MKRYGIRHKETGEYFCPEHYDASGKLNEAAWLDEHDYSWYREAEGIFSRGRLGDVAELVEIERPAHPKPTITVIK